MTYVVQQLRLELDEMVDCSLGTSDSDHVSNPLPQGHNESVTSSRHIVQTCICGCKRGPTMERVLVSVESTDRIDSNTLGMDCSEEEFRTVEASLYQVLDRKTSNEPLRMVQQTQGQRELETWHSE